MSSRVPLALPAGIYRNGTDYQSKGRWFDCNLVRFYQGTIRPIGGWVVRAKTAVVGSARAIITWKDNSATPRAGIGTNTNLYAMSRSGNLYDITPAGFTPGQADAIAAGGFGSDTYGSGAYGAPRPPTGTVIDAGVWSLDTWGEDLIAVMAGDSTIYEWPLDTSAAAAAVANAPSCDALLATDQRILFALGANGNPRNVAWSDQQNDTLWIPDATNQAGDFDLQTYGRLMLGKKVAGVNLLLTDLDAHTGTYTADTLVYSFKKVGDGCGAISRNCAAVYDNSVYWMSKSGFWRFNGYVQPISCDVNDFVFSDIDPQQISKVTCEINSNYGEITWRYQSVNSSEVDKYVTLSTGSGALSTNNLQSAGTFHIGSMARLAGADAGVLQYPIAAGADGFIYDHENGFLYDGAVPYLEGGPVELGEGDAICYVTGLIPDEKTLGDVSVTFRPKFENEDAYGSFGPYLLASKTDIRFSGRQVNVHFDAVRATDWRIGVPRLIVEQGGER